MSTWEEMKDWQRNEEDNRIKDELIHFQKNPRPAGYKIRGLKAYYERYPELDPNRDIKERLAKNFSGEDLRKRLEILDLKAGVGGGKRRSRKQNTKKRQQRRRKSRRSQ
jgi:hypothetical protein